MKRGTVEHLAMASWLVAIVCGVLHALAANLGHGANLIVIITTGLVYTTGLILGIIALLQVPYLGKKHLFGHAVVGITLNALFLAIVLTFAYIYFVIA